MLNNGENDIKKFHMFLFSSCKVLLLIPSCVKGSHHGWGIKNSKRNSKTFLGFTTKKHDFSKCPT
jgi:hypothetical protein